MKRCWGVVVERNIPEPRSNGIWQSLKKRPALPALTGFRFHRRFQWFGWSVPRVDVRQQRSRRPRVVTSLMVPRVGMPSFVVRSGFVISLQLWPSFVENPILGHSRYFCCARAARRYPLYCIALGVFIGENARTRCPLSMGCRT
jgi:hypothetical protein